jgi:acetylornithine deacetylase/succinyl-diaminopimelate desuccinylase family protein
MSFPGTVAELLRDLVRIPSVNPAGDPGTDKVGEKRLALHLAELLRELGAKPELHEVFDDRPNLLARFPTNAPGKPRLLLAPHTDTVSVVGMTIDPFGGVIEEGKVFGRGACDTKGTIAAMLMALRKLGPDRIAQLGHEIWFVGLMGEEAGLQGARALVKHFRPDFVLVGEPTEMGIVVRHKAAAWLTIRTKGAAVHASMPEKGRNAIVAMTRIIDALVEYASKDLSREEDDMLGRSTLSVGVITGGSKVNIVPDSCVVEVDVRFIPSIDVGKLERDLREVVRKAEPDAAMDFLYTGPLQTDPAHPLIGVLQEAGGTICGAPWQCDAAVFSQAGIPAVAAGPGSIAQAHTCDEWVSIDQLERGVAFYHDFLSNC